MSSCFTYDPHRHRPPDSLFLTPKANTVIWRYLPLERFRALMETRRIFLCRAGRLADEFEGATPVRSEQRLIAWEEKYVSAENRAQYRKNRERAREIVVVNCWQMSNYESVPMWERYVPGMLGVALKCTVGSLGAAFDQHPNNGNSGLDDIDISRVLYIDYDTDHFALHNSFNHFIHKRLEYESEKELRVFTMITKQAAAASAAGGTEFEVTNAGLFLPVNVETLIEGIFIAPRAPAAVEQTVHDVLKRQGLESIPVLPSALTKKPMY